MVQKETLEELAQEEFELYFKTLIVGLLEEHNSNVDFYERYLSDLENPNLELHYFTLGEKVFYEAVPVDEYGIGSDVQYRIEKMIGIR